MSGRIVIYARNQRAQKSRKRFRGRTEDTPRILNLRVIIWREGEIHPYATALSQMGIPRRASPLLLYAISLSFIAVRKKASLLPWSHNLFRLRLASMRLWMH